MLNYARYSFMLFVVFMHCILIIMLIYTNNDSLHIFGKKALQSLHPTSILAVISGYFYYSTFKMTTLSEFMKSGIYTKRLKRLIIPYFSWKLVIFFIFMIFFLGVGFTGSGVDGKEVLQLCKGFAKSLFTSNNDEWSLRYLAFTPHLWYIHHLFIMFLVTPFLMHYKFFQYATPFILLVLYMTFPKMELFMHFRFILFFAVGCYLGINRKLAGKIFRFSIKIYSVAGIIAALYIITRLSKHFFHVNFMQMGFGVSSEYSDLPNTIGSLVYPTLAFIIVQCILHSIGLKKDMKYQKAKHYMLYILHQYIIMGCIELFLLIPVFRQAQNTYWFVISATVAAFFITVIVNSLFTELLEKNAPKLQKYLV